jgi:hypothetical protein
MSSLFVIMLEPIAIPRLNSLLGGKITPRVCGYKDELLFFVVSR